MNDGETNEIIFKIFTNEMANFPLDIVYAISLCSYHSCFVSTNDKIGVILTGVGHLMSGLPSGGPLKDTCHVLLTLWDQFSEVPQLMSAPQTNTAKGDRSLLDHGLILLKLFQFVLTSRYTNIHKYR